MQILIYFFCRPFSLRDEKEPARGGNAYFELKTKNSKLDAGHSLSQEVIS